MNLDEKAESLLEALLDIDILFNFGPKERIEALNLIKEYLMDCIGQS